ncbi:glycosyltransferase family 2 protein [Polynucleobacter sp. MWH-UH25E]|uniref:glycosyltransferase family 2 protein n=1 Tax=Polynucleobacter sp. MWH-UH25E TaxID=1855616 RepID=UPI001BFD9C0A|nr:glycosyltransferase family 2 protein [Polynucleobacter sp. MWH-UH25E]QWD62360.1 glycosyltransferase [Polynucleobacter sp. MWH-UH25E]
MKANLTISVITPSYNQADFLEETIQSVLSQNYPYLEYIIIDGGSDDGSVDIIKKYQNNIYHWVSERDGGQSEAINKGLRLATGDIVCWLNSDDLLMPNTLKTIAHYFQENSDAQFIYGNGVVFHDDCSKKEVNCQPGRVDRKMLGYCDPIQQPSTFWRREIHSKLGYLDEDLFFTMDWDWFVRVASFYPLHYLPINFSKYRIHKDHKTGNGGVRRAEEIHAIVKKYGPTDKLGIFAAVLPFAEEIRDLRSKYGWRFGRVAFYFLHPKLFMSYGFGLKNIVGMY